MKTKETFTKYFNKTELTKYVNYCFFNSYFDKQTTVKSINTLTSDMIIFTVVSPANEMLFRCKNSDFSFQDCKVNKKNQIVSVWGCTNFYNNKALKSILTEIDFFQRFPKDAAKMQFPEINLKCKIEDVSKF